MKKLNLNIIKEYVLSQNNVCVTTTYINCRTKLDFICPNKHEYSMLWHNFKNGKRCKSCNLNNNYKGGVVKLNIPLYKTYAHQLSSYQEVYLIEEFIGNNLLELLGVSCHYCSKIFIPTTVTVRSRIHAIKGIQKGSAHLFCSKECKCSCVNFHQKDFPKGFKKHIEPRWGHYTWAKEVKLRANYACQKCGESYETMYAHHVVPYTVCKFMYLDPDNGKCFCKNATIKFTKKMDVTYMS